MTHMNPKKQREHAVERSRRDAMEPYTEADVKLVAGWFKRWLGASTIRQRDRDCAVEVLSALVAAGRLAPAAGVPYTSRLLAENDKLNDDLRLMQETVATLVDQRDAARREANVAATNAIKFHHRVLHLEAELANARGDIELLREQLGQAVDVLMANGWKQEADRLDELTRAREGQSPDRHTADPGCKRNPSVAGSSFAFALAARGLVAITGNDCCGGNGVEASCEVCRRD